MENKRRTFGGSEESRMRWNLLLSGLLIAQALWATAGLLGPAPHQPVIVTGSSVGLQR